MPDVRRIAAGTVVAVVCLVGISSCEGDDGHAPATVPSETSTPLTELSTDTLVVRRESFCSAVDADRVEEALGGPPDASSAYDNGEPARLTTEVRDVVHEFGCAWRRADGVEARAWVFAPPVTLDRARAVARDADAARGCSAVPEAPAFGRPSAAVVCRVDAALEASYRGLFGDAWLSCSLTVPGAGADQAELMDRSGRWCAAVAIAASDTTGEPAAE